MSSQKLRRRQTIQPTLNNKLLPTSLLNQLSTSDNNSRKSFDTNVSKDQSQSQQSETIPVQTSKKPSAQPRKSIQGVFPLQKKNSNVQQSTSDKQQGVLYGGDNTNSSVYDKYKQNFAKLLLQGLTGDKKTKDGEQGNDDQGGAGSNKLTPMPQLQKKEILIMLIKMSLQKLKEVQSLCEEWNTMLNLQIEKQLKNQHIKDHHYLK